MPELPPIMTADNIPMEVGNDYYVKENPNSSRFHISSHKFLKMKCIGLRLGLSARKATLLRPDKTELVYCPHQKNGVPIVLGKDDQVVKEEVDQLKRRANYLEREEERLMENALRINNSLKNSLKDVRSKLRKCQSLLSKIAKD